MKISDIFNRLSPTDKIKEARSTVYDDELTTLKLRCEFLQQVYNNEMDRKKNVENKASSIIGSQVLITVIMSILIGFLNRNNYSIADTLFLIWGVILMLILISTIIFATLVLRRKNFTVIFTNDQENIASPKEYYENMIKTYQNSIENNKEIINDKVTKLSYSQCLHSSFLCTFSTFIVFWALDSYFNNASCWNCLSVIISVILILADISYTIYLIFK